MIFGLDFDGTYTADPVLWNSFIQNSIKRGHSVHIVTQRDESSMEEVMRFLKASDLPLGIQVNFCAWQQKEKFMMDRGIRIDVWIDDKPWVVR